jgi:hypothetical protein
MVGDSVNSKRITASYGEETPAGVRDSLLPTGAGERLASRPAESAPPTSRETAIAEPESKPWVYPFGRLRPRSRWTPT